MGAQFRSGDWEDPTALQLPWTELGDALEAEGAFSRGNVFVAGTDWIECGYIDTQVEGRTPLACIGPDPRNLAYNFDAEAHAGWDAYVVAQTGNIERVIDRLDGHFEGIEHIETLTVSRSGVVELGNIQLYRATGFRP